MWCGIPDRNASPVEILILEGLDPAVTQHLLHALRTGQSLPASERLEADAVLEASAARAIDLNDPWRIPVLLHADDPLFFASSVGEMRRVLRVVAAWSRRYKTTLHCTVLNLSFCR